MSACGFAPETIRQQFHAYDVFAKPIELSHFLQALRDVCGLESPKPSAISGS